MSTSMAIPYRLSRWVLRTAMGVYFARIERFHPERVPRTGPVIFTSNHPNSLTDAFAVGASVPRKVNFVATVQLFRLTPLRWLLTRCGVIPINRVKDDPRAMRTVLDTFEACFRVLEKGEAVGIFPEGITHDDPQLKTVKTGAARMALELEHRHGGKLSLQIVPVGLTFSAKERYRSEVLVHFGEPIRIADFLAGYPEQKHDCIHKLTAEIEHRIESLILHLPKLERARTVAAVKRLYLDRLYVGNRVIHEPVPPKAGELMLTQAIASAVDFTYAHHPERATVFAQKLAHYERRLKRLNLSDDELALFSERGRLVGQSLAWTALGVVLFPVALYGWVHRLLPALLVNRAIHRFAELSVNKTHVSTAAIISGALSFGVLYGGYIAIVQALFGFPVSLWYALSLPIAGVVAHYYLRGLIRFAQSARCLFVLLRAPSAARRLQALRSSLIAEIEGARWQVPAPALTHERKAPL
jgi:glycerol-3-phosphate O-acyltransferase / dihydroxyacetone phosphate acyltransferase